jgi:hypothetical protein
LVVTVNVPIRTHQETSHKATTSIDRIFDQAVELIMKVNRHVNPTA